MSSVEAPADAPRERDVVVVDRLVKTYGQRRAVDRLGFTVRAGETFALLGPNGAGKTSTVEILEGYRRADSGTVRVLGLDPLRDAARLKPRIGVMLQECQLYRGIRVREALRLFARFYPVPADLDALLRLVGLENEQQVSFRALSGGQRKRLALALTLVGRPEIAFLDEPTAGMDPHARKTTWELIRALGREGVTVLLTTHFMDEAERLANRIAIIDSGRLLALGTPETLTRTDASVVRFRARPRLDCARLAALPSAGGAREEQPGLYAVKTAAAPELLVELTSWLRDEQILLTELRVGHESLEQVFLQLTREPAR